MALSKAQDTTGSRGRKGQMIMEYTLMFVAITAVIIYASMNIIRPSVNRFFNASGHILDNATNEIQSRF